VRPPVNWRTVSVVTGSNRHNATTA
jgi:hypothetical protein